LKLASLGCLYRLRTSEEWIEISELGRNKERQTTLDAAHETKTNKAKDATPKTIKMDNTDHTYQNGQHWPHLSKWTTLTTPIKMDNTDHTYQNGQHWPHLSKGEPYLNSCACTGKAMSVSYENTLVLLVVEICKSLN
jgi:hypothetical protein